MNPLMWLAVWLVLSSVMSIFLFGLDKRAAQQNRRRVPEKRLLVVAALGGWPGAVFASVLFRHKTIKTSFRVKLIAASIFNVLMVSAIVWCTLIATDP